MSKKKKDISEAVTLESTDENIVVADTEAEGEPSVSEEKEEKKKKIARKNLKNRSRCGSLARFWNYIHIIIWRMTSLTYGFALRMA